MEAFYAEETKAAMWNSSQRRMHLRVRTRERATKESKHCTEEGGKGEFSTYLWVKEVKDRDCIIYLPLEFVHVFKLLGFATYECFLVCK